MGEDVDTARFWSCTVTIQGDEIERVVPEKAFDLVPSAI